MCIFRPLYRKLRNKVQRMAAMLHKRFYTHKIESLHSADPHSCRRKTKQFLHHKHSDPLHNLEVLNPNVSLAEAINDFFVSVSAHLDSILAPLIVSIWITQRSLLSNRLKLNNGLLVLVRTSHQVPMAYQTGSCVILPP